MTEPYHIQKERIRQELKDAHRPYNFYRSEIAEKLYKELDEAYEVMDIELGLDIMADMETARRNFNANLPWWYVKRWDMSDLEIYGQARDEYEKQIYKGGGVVTLISDLVYMRESNPNFDC